MNCVIIAGGEFKVSARIKKIIQRADMIVCADSGARHLRDLGILPHILMGDFDSIDPDDLAFFKKNKIKHIRFPERKDQTDSELCIDWAIENKAHDITLLGVTGTRLDHSLANIFLLKKIGEHHIKARIINPTNEIFLVRKELEIKGKPGDFLSILPLSQKVEGITLDGLEYPLKNADIELGSSLGISNRFVHTHARIQIQSGLLIVTKSKD